MGVRRVPAEARSPEPALQIALGENGGGTFGPAAPLNLPGNCAQVMSRRTVVRAAAAAAAAAMAVSTAIAAG